MSMATTQVTTTPLMLVDAAAKAIIVTGSESEHISAFSKPSIRIYQRKVTMHTIVWFLIVLVENSYNLLNKLALNTSNQD